MGSGKRSSQGAISGVDPVGEAEDHSYMKSLLTVLAMIAAICWASPSFADDPFWSLLTPLTAPVVAPQGAEGQEFLSVDVQHREVGILQNDIRGTGLVNSDRIVIPSGTPVFHASFGTSGGTFAPARHYEGWCGVVRDGDRSLGYCMLRQGSGYVLGKLPSNESFYTPTRLADYGLRPITTPEVRPDEAARANLPRIIFSYALDAWRPGGVVLERSVRIDGRQFRLGSIFIDRNDDGTATLSVGQYGYTISIANGGEALTVVPRD